MTDIFEQHQPVMLEEVLENLNIQADGIYVDATFGRGGHSAAILKNLGKNGHLFAIDKDPKAVKHARKTFVDDKRFTIWHGTFANLSLFLSQEKLMGKVNGILLDLGVSSPQLDDPDRGFSFMRSGKLDMRMDDSQGQSAAEWLAKVSETDLANVLWEYGEERFSRRIAKAIVIERGIEPIITTDRLAAIIAKAHPAWQKGKHPATRCFQAIRIEINKELEDLEKGLDQSMEALRIGGRLLVISFHSLEDRIVKHFMQKHERNDTLPANFPVKHDDSGVRFKRVGRAIKPSSEEIAMNARARSAVLRIGEKLI